MHYSVLQHNIMHSMVWYNIASYSVVQHSMLCCITLYCIALYCVVLYVVSCFISRCSALCHIVSHYNIVQYSLCSTGQQSITQYSTQSSMIWNSIVYCNLLSYVGFDFITTIISSHVVSYYAILPILHHTTLYHTMLCYTLLHI